MACELLDWECIFVNELIGSAGLAVLILFILYFVVASKLRFGFDTTIVLAFPLLLILALAITSFTVIFAFATLLVGIMLAWLFDRIIGNR